MIVTLKSTIAISPGSNQEVEIHEISFSDFRTSIVHVEKERQVGNGIARRMALERDHGHAVEHMLRRDHAVMRGAGGGVARV